MYVGYARFWQYEMSGVMVMVLKDTHVKGDRCEDKSAP